MKVAIIRLREAGQLMTYKLDKDINVNDYVIIEADRGTDYGQIVEINQMENFVLDNDQSSLKNVIRKVTPEDVKQIKENKKETREAAKTCSLKIREYKLQMKLVDTEYSFDKKKIIFYFTAEDRIDFRELVKDLAKIFKIRIEMRQIGVRDETKLFGGIGPCGRPLCCGQFLKSFEPVSIKMAKLQKLPLTSGKISGICRRLMCCLSYEYKTYRELAKGLPKEGRSMDTPKGKGKIISVNVLKRIAYVELGDGRIEKISFDNVES